VEKTAWHWNGPPDPLVRHSAAPSMAATKAGAIPEVAVQPLGLAGVANDWFACTQTRMTFGKALQKPLVYARYTLTLQRCRDHAVRMACGMAGLAKDGFADTQARWVLLYTLHWTRPLSLLKKAFLHHKACRGLHAWGRRYGTEEKGAREGVGGGGYIAGHAWRIEAAGRGVGLLRAERIGQRLSGRGVLHDVCNDRAKNQHLRFNLTLFAPPLFGRAVIIITAILGFACWRHRQSQMS